ncbi:MAG: DUF3237 domain-containing protein [Mycobacteriaceae bacterium]|nr:DUF3237 domain-containing protein [Mycobacteriaceae bacterium]
MHSKDSPVTLIDSAPESALPVEHICDIVFPFVAAPDAIPTRNGVRQVFSTSAGTVTGPRLNGIALPGIAVAMAGSDNVLVSEHIHAMLHTDDGESVFLTAGRGILKAGDDTLAELKSGQTVDHRAIYSWIPTTLETAAPKYQWLSSVMIVSRGYFTMELMHAQWRLYALAE